jgi:hypothetical protein
MRFQVCVSDHSSLLPCPTAAYLSTMCVSVRKTSNLPTGLRGNVGILIEFRQGPRHWRFRKHNEAIHTFGTDVMDT